MGSLSQSLPATDARLAAVVARLEGLLAMQQRDQNGALLQYDACAPVLLAREDGQPVDGYTFAGTASAKDENVWSIDTTYAKSLTFDYIAGASSSETTVEGTVDGSVWKPVTLYILDRIERPITGVHGPTGRHFGANTSGYIAMRLRIQSTPSGPITSIVRTSTHPLPAAHTVSRFGTAVLVGVDRVTGSSRNTAVGMIEAENVASAKRYVQIAQGQTYDPANRVWTLGLPAGACRDVTFPTGGISVSGFSIAATTDFEGKVFAGVNDVRAWVGYSA